MTFPLYPDVLGYEAFLVLGTLIGIAFGFVLEGAGFGRAPNLAAQFYGSDTRVLKVMFGAIVTALLGMTVLSGAGLLDLSRLQVPPTFLWPQIAGGFLLGVGFIISGYCPGTAWVSMVSGNLDGLWTIAGVLVGSLGFGLVFPFIEGFYEAGALGVVTLPSALGVPQAVLAAGVTAMAVGAFLFGEWVERTLARKRGEEAPPSDPRLRNRVFAGFGVAAVAALGLLAVPAAPVELPEKTVATLDAVGLAKALVEDPSGLALVDLRGTAECEAARIPGAACVPAEDPEARFLAGLPAGRTLVLYAAADLPALPDAARRFPGDVAALKGGYAAFRKEVLEAPAAPADPTPEALADFKVRSALHGYFTGSKAAAPPPPAVRPVAPAGGDAPRKGGGC